jgi:diadenosine tetraphosphate (Ap4A) HIT family hydrolase
MNELCIFESDFWMISHRKDSRYQGYLIVSSKSEASEISELCIGSLQEIGHVLSRTEKLLFEVFSPYKVIVAKLGFSKGFSCHFHCIPATNEFMKEIANHSGYTSEPDGNDALLYASREYCERELTIEEKMAMEKTVSQLRTYS